MPDEGDGVGAAGGEAAGGDVGVIVELAGGLQHALTGLGCDVRVGQVVEHERDGGAGDARPSRHAEEKGPATGSRAPRHPGAGPMSRSGGGYSLLNGMSGMRLAARAVRGMVCNQTLPGPLRAARKMPSPPKSTFFTPLTIVMS